MKIRTLLILILLVTALTPLGLVVSLNLPRVLARFDQAETNRQLLVLQQEYLEASAEMRWGQDTLRALSFSKGVVELVSHRGKDLPPARIRPRVVEMVDGWYQKSPSIIALRLLSLTGDEQLKMVRGDDGVLRVVPNQKLCDANIVSVLQTATATAAHTVFNAGVNREHVYLDIQDKAILHLGVAIYKDGAVVGLACLAFDLTAFVNERSGILFQQDHPDKIIYAASRAGTLLDYFQVDGYDFASEKPGLIRSPGGKMIRLVPVFLGGLDSKNIWMGSAVVAGDTMVWVKGWRQQLFIFLAVLVLVLVAIAMKLGSVVEGVTADLSVAFRDLLQYQRPMNFTCSGTLEFKKLGEELGSLSRQYLEHNVVQQKMRNESDNLASRLRQAQKMEAVGLLAGGVAHDLNNILSGIVSYPQLLLLQLPAESPLRKSILAIQESGERAAAVVDDLLTVARGAASGRELCDLNQLLKDYFASGDYLKLAESHPDVTCGIELSSDPLWISCSVVHIKKVLTNLVNQGVESVGTSGSLYVASRKVHQQEDEQAWAELVVGDSGEPISSEDLEHIFEPFYIKRKMGRSGTGLELAVVWNTMSDHHGTVTVESGTDGTLFILRWPMASEGRAPVPLALDEKGLRGNGEHILVVDDEQQQRDIASKILEFYGYKVDVVSSGEKAVAFCEKQSVQLLVLDMILNSGINGRETYEQIERNHPGQRAIIVSGFSENEEVRKAHDRGARGFVKKPYSMEQLAQAVKEELHRS